MLSILIVDDEKDWLHSLKRTLYSYKITGRENIHLASNGREMFEVLESKKIDLVILDLFLENENGEDLLEQILAADPAQYVVFMTGSNSVENAVECMKKGAKDYLVKSTPVDELVHNFRRIAKIRELELENQFMKKQALSRPAYAEFSKYVTQSPQIFSIFEYMRSLAKTSQHILITGESGAGKGIVAKLAASMLRPGKPFVSINVAGYDDQMFADALFGHVKGAFTGAERQREGMLRQAEGGVLFLDEIGDLALQSQVKLLYLLQDGEYQQLGSDDIQKAQVKFIFASNQDLALKLQEKAFRNDLFFRLNTHRIHLPPLRQRPEDIPLLVSYFAGQAAAELGKAQPVFSDGFMEKLRNMRLPGNIRQLRSIIYDLAVRHDGLIGAEHLENTDEYEPGTTSMAAGENTLKLDANTLPTVQEVTDQLIRLALEKSGGNQQRAAQMLQISQPTLSRRLKRMRGEEGT